MLSNRLWLARDDRKNRSDRIEYCVENLGRDPPAIEDDVAKKQENDSQPREIREPEIAAVNNGQ